MGCCRPRAAAGEAAGPYPASGFEAAGWASLVTWSWVNAVMAKRGALTAESLWRLLEWDTAGSVHGRLRDAGEASVASGRPSLRRAFVTAFWARYAAWGTPAWVKAGCIIAQTQFLALLLDELRSPADTSPKAAYLYALGLVATGAAVTVLHHAYFYHAWRAGLNWRTAATALLFSKSLTLRLDALAATSAGRVINIASSDVERLQKLCQYVTYLFVAPVEGAVCIWLLFREVGVATLAGIAVLAAFVAVQVWASRAFGRLRSETTVVTDERVRLTGQVIAGVRVLKMYGWEPPFLAAVRAVRSREMLKIGSTAVLRGLNEGLFGTVPLMVGGATFLTYYATGATLTPRNIFVSMSLFSLLQVDVCKFVQLGLEALAEVNVTFARLQAFLLLPDATPPPLLPVHTGGADAPAPPAIVTSALCATWSAAPSAEPVYSLRDVSLSLATGSLCTILGAVGAGKTSLLMALLHELRPTSGTCTVRGRVVYVAQSPWIMTFVCLLFWSTNYVTHTLINPPATRPTLTLCSGTVRDNITFGKPYDADRMSRVIDACCLRDDLAGFAHGDLEVIGERGVNLSGGYVPYASVFFFRIRVLTPVPRGPPHPTHTADNARASVWRAPATRMPMCACWTTRCRRWMHASAAR